MVLSRSRRRAALVIGAVFFLGLAACTSDDSSEAADLADDTSGVGADATSDTDGSGADSATPGSELLDVSAPECRAAVSSFLVEVEPIVSGLDWSQATLAEVDQLSPEFSQAGADLESKLADAGCENLDPGTDEAALEFLIGIAEEDAPGTVQWLQEFVAIAGGAVDSGVPVGESPVPDDCDGVLEYLNGLVSGAESMMDLPIRESANFSTAMTTLQRECSPEQAQEFVEANSAFFGG